MMSAPTMMAAMASSSIAASSWARDHLPPNEPDGHDRQQDIEHREGQEGYDEPRHRRHRVGGAHDAIDDPRLASDLGYDPPRLDGDEAERCAQGHGQQEVSRRMPCAGLPPPPAPSEPEADQ